MKKLGIILLSGVAFAAAASAQSRPAPRIADSFAEARKTFTTQIGYPGPDPAPLEKPPAGVFDIIHYPAAPGPLAAYVTPDPKDGKRHPAIIWMTGGESNSLGEMWAPRPRDNDQSAAAYRKAGVVLMTPTLRGGNDNPGKEEAFAGEIDDILAAADYLAGLPYVDPQRIYLGGHSTGGTLALLTAEASTRFRAVFALGPIGSVPHYGDLFPVKFGDYPVLEHWMRTPGVWLESVKTPTFLIEGKPEDEDSNWEELVSMDKLTDNPNIKFLIVAKADHFSVVAPANEVIAAKILADKGPAANIKLDAGEIARAVRKKPRG